MQPVLMRAPAEIPSHLLDDLGPVDQPCGDVVARRLGRAFPPGPGERVKIGVWECSPGRWRRMIMEAEFAYFLSGAASFLPDGGEMMTIEAGDAVWFPAYCHGTWDVRQTIRKTYIVMDGGWRRRAQIALGALRARLRGQASHPQRLSAIQ